MIAQWRLLRRRWNASVGRRWAEWWADTDRPLSEWKREVWGER